MERREGGVAAEVVADCTSVVAALLSADVVEVGELVGASDGAELTVSGGGTGEGVPGTDTAGVGGTSTGGGLGKAMGGICTGGGCGTDTVGIETVGGGSRAVARATNPTPAVRATMAVAASERRRLPASRMRLLSKRQPTSSRPPGLDRSTRLRKVYAA
jgi:hypothetical protein